MKQYALKPKPVRAIQITWKSWQEISDWLNGNSPDFLQKWPASRTVERYVDSTAGEDGPDYIRMWLPRSLEHSGDMRGLQLAMHGSWIVYDPATGRVSIVYDKKFNEIYDEMAEQR